MERRDTVPAGAEKSSDTPVTQAIIEHYAQRAGETWRIAETIYTPEELAALPPSVVESALGLGHPVRDAELQPGEVVLDIGCGTGIDLLLAAPQVGPTGTVIGLDLTPEMLERAREHVTQAGLTNVELLPGSMEEIPLPDTSVDVVISNGVFNLSTKKDQAFAEAYRVLRPGGRMIAADMLLVADLPATLLENPKLWSG
ncbi:methyltransferase domain-containing protein [Nitrolancea hollandica]|uniref:Arsenite methyltransferase n=1 Tax=Nitrolancea hollandica Lb TaxID=1129897 RepID=I4EI55_9BACT